MRAFDRVFMVDWSASASPSPKKPAADAIWIAEASADGSDAELQYLRTRESAMIWLGDRIAKALAAGERVMAGFDFPFGYPAGFAAVVAGRADPLVLWADLARRIVDGADNANNRFAVAAELNGLFPGTGPFWGRPRSQPFKGLPETGSSRSGHGMAERREVEERLTRTQPCWKLYTTGSVGSQALLGLPRLHALRDRFAAHCAVWPFQDWSTASLVLTEIYPGLIDAAVKEALAADDRQIKDAVQVRLCAGAVVRAQAAGRLGAMLDAVPAGAARTEEGWILGVGAEAELLAAARASARPALTPPPLSNDCFAMPRGVDWTPVDVALAHLRDNLGPVTGLERVDLGDAVGRVLAEPLAALRAHPPAANSAVDGYGFAASGVGSGAQILPLAPGRAAAGVPFSGSVATGHAVRILTGALIPDGVDTVVLEEDVTCDGSRIAFDGPLKPGANTRPAGEDVGVGQALLPTGRVLGPADLALAASAGLSSLPVRARLRVAVLSTGDELIEPKEDAPPERTIDANRPMLLALLARWGFETLDLGRVADDTAALARALDQARREADVLLTSGGASAGDEDHVSAILRERGVMEHWRIALKPGRPLALGLWRGMPVFGLPGNPVAAFVCSLIFARPALWRLAGGDWETPAGFDCPAAFEKRKKPGRREYLRARRDPDGRVAVFRSEGSGRVSGLSWADGLVELDDGARQIRPGDPVRYLPFSSFGL